MFKLIVSLLLAVALSGCAEIKPREFTGPNGNPAFAVGCDNLVVCYEKIGKVCNSKYSIISITSNSASFPHGGEMLFVFYHYIAVECQK
jgi:hypothetical protein